MWDRNQRRAARQAFRNARRGYRYSNYRRTPFFGIFIFILIVIFVSHFWFLLIPLAIMGGFLFMWLRGSMFNANNSGLFGNNTNYQQPNQPNQYYQPSQQPYQPDQSNQYYQPPTPSQPNTPYMPPYQSYDQGYQTPVQNGYQQDTPLYKPQPAQEQQYEEPQAHYPQEMPPMK